MRRAAAALALFLCADARAQAEQLFAAEAPRFAEQEIDRRFGRSRVARGLSQGSEHPGCVQLLSGLFTVLAEVAPTLHRRDQDFFVDPHLVAVLDTQLSTPRFSASAYLASMVRRVLIDGRLPPQWLPVATALQARSGVIDLAKLQFLAEGVRPVDSFYFSFPKLLERYDAEVRRATSASRASALLEFRSAYLDRQVAWAGMRLLDVGPPKARKGRKLSPAEKNALVARLEYRPPEPEPSPITLVMPRKKERPVAVEAWLSPQQYVDVARIPKGTPLIVRGRFYEMDDALARVEVRGALLFEDRDWSKGAVLAAPEAVASCPLAVNELTGAAPDQPGGFGQRP